MKIDVAHVAKLARLGITPEEKEVFEKQLSAILEYAEILNRLDTGNVEPTSHAIPMENAFRDDAVSACENVEEILSNAPELIEHMFRVPRIIE